MAQCTKAVNYETKQKLWKFPAWLKQLCMCKEKHCSWVSMVKYRVWMLFGWLNLKGMNPGILLETWNAQEETLKTKHGDLISSCLHWIHFPCEQLVMWDKVELEKEVIFNSARVLRPNSLHLKSTLAALCTEACATGRENKSAGSQPKLSTMKLKHLKKEKLQAFSTKQEKRGQPESLNLILKIQIHYSQW